MLTVGTYLADRYEIVSKIGAGGMSDVYKAKDHVLGRFVAIKVLKPEFSEDRGFVAKFRTYFAKSSCPSNTAAIGVDKSTLRFS